MIKINLSIGAKKEGGLNLGGFDFTKIKIKAVLLAIVLIYAPDFFLLPYYEEELTKTNEQLNTKSVNLTSLKRKVQQSENLEKQITELKLQEETLGQKLIAVKKAISEKRNPSALLLYIAKNIPTDLWIRDLQIDDTTMTIKGESLDYSSIGNFVNSLRSSVFIREANITSTVNTLRETDKRRIENFEVRFTIARFEQ